MKGCTVKYLKDDKTGKFVLSIILEKSRKQYKTLSFVDVYSPSYLTFSINCDYKEASLDELTRCNLNILYLRYNKLNMFNRQKKEIENDMAKKTLLRDNKRRERYRNELEKLEQEISNETDIFYNNYQTLAISLLPENESTLGMYLVKRFIIDDVSFVGVCLSNVKIDSTIDVLYVNVDEINVTTLNINNIIVKSVRFKSSVLRESFIELAKTYNHLISLRKEYEKKSDKELLSLILENIKLTEELQGLQYYSLLMEYKKEYVKC